MVDKLDIGATILDLVAAARTVFKEDVYERRHVVSVDHYAVEFPKFSFVELTFLKLHSAVGNGSLATAAVSVYAAEPTHNDGAAPVIGNCHKYARIFPGAVVLAGNAFGFDLRAISPGQVGRQTEAGNRDSQRDDGNGDGVGHTGLT